MYAVNTGRAVRLRLVGHRQAGFGLMEFLIAAVVGLIAVLGMVLLVAGTVGRSTDTLQMTHLSQGLRAGMQLMTRDLRRANFHSSFLQCFGNTNCRTDLGITAYVKAVSIDPAGDCFWFWLDRNGDGNLANDLVGAYRRGVVDGVGVLQMRISGNAAADCDDDAGWQALTDRNEIDITALTVTEGDSYSEILSAQGDSQVVQKITLTVQGRLVMNPAVSRTVQDLVHVRNDVESAPVPPT